MLANSVHDLLTRADFNWLILRPAAQAHYTLVDAASRQRARSAGVLLLLAHLADSLAFVPVMIGTLQFFFEVPAPLPFS